ncbi:HD-GYP domain-containing protein [Maridesulfovibrio zosterae]|uniref:HD-GYP domain-containing protein n=1 Tax=Maridesulfovibrio zosterae TaxID=82171 RepID=UPI000688C695|nr:HD-GYP domain-containing protein [Maridesulfovibrio zosterae]
MFTRILQFFDFSDWSFFSSSHHIQMSILRRIAGVSVLLAVCVGSIAYYSEMRNVGQEVGQMAINQVDYTMKNSLPLITNPTKENLVKLNSILKIDLDRSDFVLIELYTPEKEEMAEAAQAGVESIDQQAAIHGKELLKQEQTTYRNFVTGGHHYVQVFTALKDQGEINVGYFEGLYRVSDAKWSAIVSRVYYIVGFVVFAVLGTAAILYPIICRLISGILSFSTNLAEANIGMLISMGAAIAKRDCDTDAHNYRVTILAVMLAESLGLSAEKIRTLIVGSFLHDVGKIAIADAILLKPGKLNEDEWTIMKTHVDHGVDVVKEHAWLAQAIPVVHAHHEKYDGTGYPSGLTGENIPLGARIFALADVFDALYSKRPYKDPFPFEKCLSIIEEGSGNHFDPMLVEPFIKVAKKFVTVPDLEKTEVLRPILVKYIDNYFQIILDK